MNFSFARRRLSAPLYRVWRNKTKWRVVKTFEPQKLIKCTCYVSRIPCLGCIPLGGSVSVFMIQSKEPSNPLWACIHRFFGVQWCVWSWIINPDHDLLQGMSSIWGLVQQVTYCGPTNSFLRQKRYQREFTFQKEFIYNLFRGIHWRQSFNFAYTRHLQSAAHNQKERRSPL